MTVGAGGVTVMGNAITGQLSFAGTTSAFTVTGNVNQDLAGGTTNNFTFNTGGTVDPSTALTITGETAVGVPATIVAPTVTAGETMTQYANALTSALAAKGIVNVTVTPNAATGRLSIVGANISTANNVVQDLTATTTNYDFGSSATVDPGTNLKITGQNALGVTVPIVLPTVTAGESVADYAADLNTALGRAHIVGVQVSSTGGQLSITGANSSITGSASQDLTATTIGYNFGSSGGTVATVNPAANLTITGLTTSGATATISTPAVTTGETVAQYAAALSNALAVAGITGVTVSSTAAGQLSIVGANITAAGSVIQDPVASANATGALTFDSSGNLVSPAANVSGYLFCRTLRWSRGDEDDLGYSGLQRHPDHQTGRLNFHRLGGHPERLCERSISELFHRLGRHRHGHLFEWADRDRRSTGAGQRDQPPGVGAPGQWQLRNHAGQRRGIDRRIGNRRSGHDQRLGG